MYKLASSDQTRTVLVMDRAMRVIQWIFGALGAILVPVGFITIAIDPAGFGAYLVGIGCIFLPAAVLMGENDRLMPRQLEFRNDEGCFVAADQNGRTASVPYSDLLGFFAFDKRQRVGYWISVVLKSGAFWDMAYEGGPGRWRKKDEWMQLFQSHVQLQHPLTASSPSPTVPEWIDKQQTDDGVTYRWQERASLRDTLVISSLFAGFTVIFAGALADFLDTAAGPFVQFACVALLLFTVGLHIYRRLNRFRLLIINDEQVVYGRPGTYSNAVEEVLSSIDRTRLLYSYYSFDLAGSQRYSIFFVDSEARHVLNSLRVGGVNLDDIFNFMKRYSHLFKISFIGRPVLDIVNLQQDIQRELDSTK